MFGKGLTSSRVFRQYVAGFSCCLSMSVLSSAVNWPAAAIPKLRGERPGIYLNDDEITWMVSSLYLGNLVSPIPSGHLMDRFGRKTTLIYATIFTLVSWLILYFAVLPYQFYIARFLCGLSNGVIYTIAPTYIGEISEPKIRGSIGNMLTILSNFSALYVYSIGPYVSYSGLIYATSILPVIFILMFTWIPETPYYYVMKNQYQEATKSLIWFRCDKSNDEIINELNVIDMYIREQIKSKKSFNELVATKGNRKALFTVQFLAVLQRFTGIGALMTYSSVIIPANSIPFITTNQCITILGISWFVAPIISTAFLDKYYRRTLLIISSIGCGVTLLAASTWFYLDERDSFKEFTTTYKWIPYLSFLIHAEFYSVGIGPLGTSMRGELFASNIKGKASAVTAIGLAVTSFFIGKFFLIIANHFGMYMNFLIFGVTCILSTLIIQFYLIETKGKSLEQIQDELHGVSNKELGDKMIKL